MDTPAEKKAASCCKLAIGANISVLHVGKCPKNSLLLPLENLVSLSVVFFFGLFYSTATFGMFLLPPFFLRRCDEAPSFFPPPPPPLSPPPPPPRSVPQKVSLWAAAAATKLSKRRFHYPTTVAGGGLFFPPPPLSLFRDIVSSTSGVGRRGGRGLALRIQSGAVRRNLRMHNLAAQQRTQRLRCRRETVPPRSVASASASASPACIYG